MEEKYEYIIELLQRLLKENGVLKQNFHALNKSVQFNSKDWIDGQEVRFMLNISKRTQQTLRNNATLPYTHIGRKIYYNKKDVIKLLLSNYNKN